LSGFNSVHVKMMSFLWCSTRRGG